MRKGLNKTPFSVIFKFNELDIVLVVDGTIKHPTFHALGNLKCNLLSTLMEARGIAEAMQMHYRYSKVQAVIQINDNMFSLSPNPRTMGITKPIVFLGQFSLSIVHSYTSSYSYIFTSIYIYIDI